MKINVPFAYKALVIKPNCRKESQILIKDNITVNIKEHDNLPVALRVLDTDYLWDNKNLWILDYGQQGPKRYNIFKAELVKQNTENYGESHIYSCSTSAAPFFEFWWDAKIALNDGKEVLTKEEAVNKNRKYLSDDRDEIVKKIKEIANKIMFYKGIVYKKADEPRYYTITFGFGNNHGGTSLFISNHFNPNIPMECYFNALQYEEAKAFTIEVAKDRLDDKSIPGIGKTKIEVLIPEAVKLKIKKRKEKTVA